jgi:hypothetical protein
VLRAWGGAAQAPHGAWFVRGQDPILFGSYPARPKASLGPCL